MTPQELINEANCNRAIPSPQPLSYESNLASETAQALRVLTVGVAVLEEGQADG